MHMQFVFHTWQQSLNAAPLQLCFMVLSSCSFCWYSCVQSDRPPVTQHRTMSSAVMKLNQYMADRFCFCLFYEEKAVEEQQ